MFTIFHSMPISYDLWWEKMGDELKSAYAIATDKSFWPLTSATLLMPIQMFEA